MAHLILYLATLLTAAAAIFIIFYYFLTARLDKFLHKLFQSKQHGLQFSKLIQHISLLLPFVVLSIGIAATPKFIDGYHLGQIVKFVNCFIYIILAIIITDLIDIAGHIYQQHFYVKPIKGYLQILKIATYTITILLILATILDQSPLFILSGLGAMAAIVLLVFQDTLLSFIAGIQISSTDMVKVGDWIELPNLNVDGTVIDIALHTVTVKNWDNTIAHVPIRKLVTDSFRNWRGMQQSGGRRIKRSIHIDQETIRFLTKQEQKRLKDFKLLKEYLHSKISEIEEWNQNLGSATHIAENTRRLTNLGTLRAYMLAYLHNHPHIRTDMTLLVRQLPPTQYGLPIEIYCFVKETGFVTFESIQSDIFDHFYSIIPSFHLGIFQAPSGRNLQAHFNNIPPKAAELNN